MNHSADSGRTWLPNGQPEVLIQSRKCLESSTRSSCGLEQPDGLQGSTRHLERRLVTVCGVVLGLPCQTEMKFQNSIELKKKNRNFMS